MSSDRNKESLSPAANVLRLRQIASWRLEKLRPEQGDYPIAGIPSFQRGSVWKPAQAELLWDSLLRAFPIGAFVLCRRPMKQLTRDVKDEDLAKFTHHLLDGQQRALGITLAFEDPFPESPASPREILWLDLNPKLKPNSTRQFWFRVTTEAHPWGYDHCCCPKDRTTR